MCLRDPARRAMLGHRRQHSAFWLGLDSIGKSMHKNRTNIFRHARESSFKEPNLVGAGICAQIIGPVSAFAGEANWFISYILFFSVGGHA